MHGPRILVMLMARPKLAVGLGPRTTLGATLRRQGRGNLKPHVDAHLRRGAKTKRTNDTMIIIGQASPKKTVRIMEVARQRPPSMPQR
jgi:hypothetical protein